MSKSFRTISALALAAALALPGGALADETGNSLQSGKMGFRFAVPNASSTSVGGNYVLSGNSALQFDVGFGYQAEDGDEGEPGFIPSGWGVKAGGYYVGYMNQARVSPYYKGGLTLAKNGGDANKGNDDMELALAGGLGVEFWITKEFTLGGEALLGAPVAPHIKLGTAMSSLFATFYFDL